MKISDITEGVNSDIRALAGSEYSREELTALVNLIAQGGEVSAELVLHNLAKSPLVVSAFVQQRAVGVVALKIPNSSYREKVFHSAGTPELLNRFKLEVGYAFVEPTMRNAGIGIQILQVMRSKMPPGVFATTRENNTTINTMLRFAGFKETGERYASTRGDYKLILWTK
jgi:hypothetical protein